MSIIDLSPQISKDGPVFPLHGVLLFIDAKDINGDPVAEPTLTLGVQDEGHGRLVILNAALTNPSLGRYEYIHCAQAAGITLGHWQSTGVTKISLHFSYVVCHTKIKDHILIPVPSGAISEAEGAAVPVRV